MKINLFKNSFWIPAFAGMTIAVSIFFAQPAEADDSATTTIRLQIKTNDASLYDKDIDVNACADSSTASTTSINAKCAVEQSGLVSDWSWWGDDAFLNSIGSYANDYVKGIYWGWFANLEYGAVALNRHVLTSGEKLLLVYNTNPLKISVDNDAPNVNATSTITLEQFGLDASWNPVWSLATSSTLVIGGQNFDNATGTYEFIASSTGQYVIYGKKDGYIDSDPITITVQEVINNQPPTENTPPPTSSGGGGGGGILTPALAKVDLVKAIDFLNAKQSADGSYGSILQTDWAAIALASVNPDGQAAQEVKSYLLADPSALVGLNPVSDYSRRAMALMSLSINPYNGTKTNYIKAIVDLYDGQQFGDASLYNDDIFALLALYRAGYAEDEKMIQNDVSFIVLKQLADGSWGGTDLTAAAIQALKPFSSLNGVSDALVKARSFLFGVQLTDGGFGNVYATAWAMQAISALGENSADWKINNNTPESYLALSQGGDGAINKDDSNEVNRLWATSYAIPAVQGRPWLNIMNGFIKENNSSNNSTTDNLISTDELTATSTLELLEVASSSPEILELATTTPVEANDENIIENILPAEDEDDQAENATVAAPQVLSVKIAQTENPTAPDNNTEEVNNKSRENVAPTAEEEVNAPDIQIETAPVNKINENAKIILYIAGVGTFLVGALLILKLFGFLL